MDAPAPTSPGPTSGASPTSSASVAPSAAVKSLRWGILGAGGIARKFVTSARATESSNRVVAVASATAGKAEDFARKLDIPRAYGSYQELLASPNIDAVYVANTHNLHHDSVLLALEAGKHVLCEKPLAVNAREVTAMMEKAAAQNCFLMEAMWTRFLPACRQLTEWLDAGRIGEVRQIEASFGFLGNWPADGRMLNPHLAGGALLDMGIYPLSFSSLVMKGACPTEISSVLTLGPTGVDVDDVLVFRYADDTKAILRTGFRFNHDCRAVVTGTKGRITLPHLFLNQTEVHLHVDGETLVKRFPCPEEHGFRYQIDHVAECIHGGLIDSPRMPLRESLALAETMDVVRAKAGFRYPFER